MSSSYYLSEFKLWNGSAWVAFSAAENQYHIHYWNGSAWANPIMVYRKASGIGWIGLIPA